MLAGLVVACGILVPPSGIQALAPCIESMESYPLTTRKVPQEVLLRAGVLGLGDQRVAGKKLKGIPGFLASTKG